VLWVFRGVWLVWGVGVSANMAVSPCSACSPVLLWGWVSCVLPWGGFVCLSMGRDEWGRAIVRV